MTTGTRTIGSDPGAPGSGLDVRVVPASPRGTLRAAFRDSSSSERYVLALISLLDSAADELAAVDTTGTSREPLSVSEARQLLRKQRLSCFRLLLSLEAHALPLEISWDGATVSLSLPLETRRAPTTRPLWLQADPDCPAPLPLLRLPVTGTGLTPDALHALIALAVRCGGFLSAELLSTEPDGPVGRWHADRTGQTAHPITGSQQDSIWSVGSDEAASAAAWFTAGNHPAEPEVLSAAWQSQLGELLKTNASIEIIEHHLRSSGLPLPPLRLVDRNHAPPVQYMVPAEASAIASLHPTATEVVIALDFQQTAETTAAALLHALGHLALGHVRPGDTWGHWDTLETVSASTSHRSWDQTAQAFLAQHASKVPTRQVASLEECTPLEKAQLGLWRMIGDMLGESRRMHPAAERYQQAAYQRLAAQRLVSMLEEFGGAMLCDGVGLGKTYVATTALVHYTNAWRDLHAGSPEKLLADPFRITILAPHSVVSTWRREALPGLAAYGVPLASVRVISHTKLSRVVNASELLEANGNALSDMEHLLLSDLVIVDEAHNFRSLAARRTKVLRDLLRVQPRREQRRRVLLLTATPINNSLDDLRQEVSLLFSKPLWLNDNKTADGYRRQAVIEVQSRCGKARKVKGGGDVAAVVVHGQPDARFSDSIEFRDDLDFGPGVQRIGDYLKEQDKRLKTLQDEIRTAAQSGQPVERRKQVRIAEELLDRIVVQRSRSLCKEIERQQSSQLELLFRVDAGAPEQLRYSDEYDGIEDVLAGFLPLFNTDDEHNSRALSLKIYMWYDVREGLKSADETSSVVGLQRVLVLKRLESSPVSFLITLLRLAVLHAHRLQQLGNLCKAVGDNARDKKLQAALDELTGRQPKKALAKILSLATGASAADPRKDFIRSLSTAYAADRPAADPDDPPPQMHLFEAESESPRREELDRLWSLSEAVLADFATLLDVTPTLADIVFGKFEQREWPRRFIAGGDAIDWPTSATWGQRLVTDAKIRQLVARLVQARRSGQKVVVFSQFSDTIAYIQSVLRACRHFTRPDWQVVVRGLGISNLRSEELTGLLDVTASVTGSTEGRDEVVNAFAPYYRIGPTKPAADDGILEQKLLNDAWEVSWTGAILHPIDIVLATDVLAEGVNLQDAALLINYDVHWNPVRMIQRAGRIDRRLNPRIEHGREFLDLKALADHLEKVVPPYYWHTNADKAPVTVNMILPDELEQELQLRERIATKTLAIDFTLGLEQGTGAEADWMANYKYQGITSLNSLQKDRAIEQIGGHLERLAKQLTAIGVRLDWVENLNGWFRARSATEASPLVGRALIGRRGGELERFTRYLEPAYHAGAAHWFWAEKKPGESIFDGWLVLDGRPENFPPRPRLDIPFHDNVSTPLRAAYLLGAAELLAGMPDIDLLPAQNIGRPLMQGASALAAPKLGTEEDRKLIAIRDFYLLQLPSFDPDISQKTPTQYSP